MKLMIYPASRNVSVFARYAEQVKEYDEIIFVAPAGRSIKGKDFMVLDGGQPTGINIRTDFEEELAKVDAVLFAESSCSIPTGTLEVKIQEAINAKKKVILEDLHADQKEILINKQLILLHGDKSNLFQMVSQKTPGICVVPVPVIFVVGAGPNTNKLEVQMALRVFFEKQGYSILQIASKKTASFFGFEALPDEIFQANMSIRDKIIALNHYFYKRYQREKPDLMIIGIPGSFMQVNPFLYEEMGEISYLISQAIMPDAAVFCTYAYRFTQEYFNEIKALCKYKLNATVNHIAVCGNQMSPSAETRKCEYSTVPMAVIRENCMKQPFEGVSLYYTLDPSDMIRLGSAIYKQLFDNM